MSNYRSFLICDHGHRQDLYYEGLPIGIVKDGQFESHSFVSPSGERRKKELPDNLKSWLQEVVNTIPTHES